MTRRGWWVGVLLVLVAACTDVTVQPQPTAPSPTPTPQPADIIEFRVFGNVGSNTPASVRYTNSVDGTTNLPSISLPYVASLRSTESSLFLLIEATATPLTFTTGSLQVQIYVNGRLFREGFASGFTTLTASASGTWRRDSPTP